MNYTIINEKDNVAVALKDIKASAIFDINNNTIMVKSDIPQGHKFAIEYIKKEENIIKYGFPIGHVTEDVECGTHVHIHNVKTNLKGKLSYSYHPMVKNNKYENEKLVFNGYARENKEVGIRNEIWIIPTVGCINGLADIMIQQFNTECSPNDIDGVYAFKHPYGCSQLGDDLERTRTILQDLVKHPNTGGVLVFGLGCENNIVREFEKTLGKYDSNRVKFLIAQETDDEIQDGVDNLKRIYEAMRYDKRVSLPLSHLKIGLKCGGSDGFSGITANPLLGMFSDWLIAQGGTTALTEVPEMFGAETLLMNRAADVNVFNKIVDLINNFKEYFLKYEQPVYENPSPGNKVGGITTLEDKSLGCVQKGGDGVIVDVLDYGKRLKVSRGVNLINAPGNDGVSSTVLGASGCHMVLFTTGRGTPFGTFVPTVKISTNTELAEKKNHWIDFNAGVLAENIDKEKVLKDFSEYIISVANGFKTSSERYNFREITILKDGVTL